MYYFNARWYDPELGRFTTEDPIKDGGNWYAYVGNRPLVFTDPTGLGPPTQKVIDKRAAKASEQKPNSSRALAQTGRDILKTIQIDEAFFESTEVGLVSQGTIESLPKAGVLYVSSQISADEDGFYASTTAAVASSGRIHAPLLGNWGLGLTVDTGSISAELGMRLDTEQPSLSNSGVAAGFEASTVSAGVGLSYDGEKIDGSFLVGGAAGIGMTVRVMPGEFRVAVMCGLFVDFSIRKK